MTVVKGCRLLIAKPYPGSRIRYGGRAGIGRRDEWKEAVGESGVRYAMLECLVFGSKSRENRWRSVVGRGLVLLAQAGRRRLQHSTGNSRDDDLGGAGQSTAQAQHRLSIEVTSCIAAGLVLPSTTTTCHPGQCTRQASASLSIEPRRRSPNPRWSPSCGQSSWHGRASAQRISRRRLAWYISHCTTPASLTIQVRKACHKPA